MRLTIVPSDTMVIIDGQAIFNIAMDTIDPTIHAVQWYEDHGEIEFRDGRANEAFDDFSRFEQFVQLFADRKIAIRKERIPNEYSDWDDTTNEWVVNTEKKAAWDIKQQVIEYKKYLSDTDWYYARLQEIGVAVPEEIINERKTARLYIQEHEQSV